MIGTNNVSLQFGGRTLFAGADLQFTRGNCYGVIGANGAGKSTYLKILSGELEPTRGEVYKSPNERLSVLKQDHYAYNDCTALRTVLLGNPELVKIADERDALYSKEEMSEEDGVRAGELEEKYAELGGYTSESDAEILLNDLGITDEYHYTPMAELSDAQKVKVLLAQALFGNPDILLMDEPTNGLDLVTVNWLEDFLAELDSTVIVVSHDRHFLNNVCTHIVDVDFGKITMTVGNYDFWFEYTQIRQRQMREQNKKNEQKAKELQEFIQRFSANASKSKQATSRKKLLESINLFDMPVSSRRFPFISFEPSRSIGNDLLEVKDLCKSIGGRVVLDHVSFILRPRDKVAFVGDDPIARTTLFKILAGEMEPDSGSYKWGVTTKVAYMPQDNSEYFDDHEENLVDWIRACSTLTYESDVRGWLGKLLFSGDEALKQAKVLSGGEKVRCMLCRMMLSGGNVLIMDEPTNHLDLESITALNNGMTKFPESILFCSRDHQLNQTVANRIIDVTAGNFYDRLTTYDEYLEETK